MPRRMQLRRDLAARWTAVNPILSEGEIGYELDTLKMKIGDAITTWVNLPYYSSDYKVDQLTYTDTTNKVIGPLAKDPKIYNHVSIIPMKGPMQQYGTDYTVRKVTGGSAWGWYICISTSSTAPGSGSFSSGGDTSNPSVGMDSVLLSSDIVRIEYSY